MPVPPLADATAFTAVSEQKCHVLICAREEILLLNISSKSFLSNSPTIESAQFIDVLQERKKIYEYF
jgi:hypothetical protein